MDNKLYNELDDIFSETLKMLKYTEKNINFLQENIIKNTIVKKYGIDSMFGGYFCPSLILDKITGGFKKGRLLNNIPKNKDTYSVYELDKDNNLLRIQEINSYGTIFEHYIIKMGNIEYCIGILEGKKCPYVYNTRTIYSNRKLIQFDIVNSKDDLWSEQYEYTKDKIICKQYYYVPKLNGSDKSMPVGEERCPIKLYIINFRMDENNKIYWLEHGEYKKGRVEIDYEYKK
jgi:hypothetical protein